MISYLIGLMAMTVYNQTYGATSIATLMKRYDEISQTAMNMGSFTNLVNTIKGLAVGITLILYFIDLSGKVTEKNFSIEQFFKSTLRCVVSYMFIMNSDAIVGYLMSAGSVLANDITNSDIGYDFFSSEHGERKTMLINGIEKLGIKDRLSYIILALIPWLISMIGEVILQIVLISRILEIGVMTVFAPIAISDVYREGTSSSGVQYMKKMLALGMQVAVILLINIATQAIISQIMGTDGAAGQTVASLLVSTQPGGTTSDEALKNGSLVFTTDSIKLFLDTLFGHGDRLKVLGIMLARLGLIWNSLPLCEEVTGAR